MSKNSSYNLSPEKVLKNFHKYQETQSCYLDGRYVNIVLKDVPEFCTKPITISIIHDKNQNMRYINYINKDFNMSRGMNIIRVVIKTNLYSHSALLWMNSNTKTAMLSDTITNSSDEDDTNTEVQEFHEEAMKLLKESLLVTFDDYKFSIKKIKVPNDKPTECGIYGFCNAHVIKQVIDYANGVKYDPSSIRQFAAAVEDNYGHMLDPNMPPEIEYRYGRGYRGHGGYRRGFGGGYGAGLAGLGVGLGLGALAGAAAYPSYGYGYPSYGYGYSPYGYGYV